MNIRSGYIKAFTLVELIVVITILAILATIAFISFQGYTESSRDSVRLSDMANIEKGFNLMLAKDEKLPIPEDKIDITASGTVITYQGYAGYKVLGFLSVNGEGKDPLDNVSYTYTTNPTRNKYQLLGFFENQNNVSMIKNTYADFTHRFPKVKGDELGIILDLASNEPLQVTGTGVDIITTVSNNYIAIFGNKAEMKVPFTNNNRIIIAYPTSSCRSLYETGIGRIDGVYSINPKGNFFDVYCDMTTEGGGWTLFYANNGNTDSPIKKSFIQMRNEVLVSVENLYGLSDYNNENLAGLLDYTIFTDLGQKEVLSANRDFLKTNNRWVKIEFNSPETLVWGFSNYILGTSHPSQGHCLDILNNGSFSIVASDGTQALNNKQIYNGWGNVFGVSVSHAPCNSYNNNLFAFFMFYSASGSDDKLRTRSPEHIGGTWTGDNQYRYFIR